MEPILPASAEKTWRMLSEKGSVHEQKWEHAGELALKGGEKIGAPKALYSKIEDDKIEEFKKKYLPIGEKKVEVKKMPEIAFSDFEKMDLRVGEIVKAEAHPSADKLYVVEVDLGELGRRTLVAGVRESYSAEELAGRRIIVVANLAPTKIRGVKSEGMLLAASGEGGKPVLLSVERKAANGSKIM
jgi:methionyl-tRNA synthetase